MKSAGTWSGRQRFSSLFLSLLLGISLPPISLNAQEKDGSLLLSLPPVLHASQFVKRWSSSLVKDIDPGLESGVPMRFTPVNGIVVFDAQSFSSGLEMWRTDGTAAGTYILKDIKPGPESGRDVNWYEDIHIELFNGVLYFAADDGIHGTELWRTDGTTAGTRMVADIAPGGMGSCPSGFTSYDGNLYFAASHVGCKDVHLEAGEEAPAQPETRIFNLPPPSTFGGDIELWRTDGTPSGTRRVLDINTKKDDAISFGLGGNDGSYPGEFCVYKGFLYFGAANGFHGWELWRTDGTSTGTTMIRDINPGANHGTPKDFTVFNNLLFFAADDGVHGSEIWYSDGFPAGTRLFVDLFPGQDSGANHLTSFIYKDHLYFEPEAYGGLPGYRLWRTDGTPSHTRLFKDISPLALLPGNDQNEVQKHMSVFNGLLYFVAVNDKFEQQLWQSDGTPQGTRVSLDIAVGPYLRTYGDFLYMNAYDNAFGAELWRTDGTAGGTKLVSDINPGPGSSSPGELSGLFLSNNALLFTADDGVHGIELWVGKYSSLKEKK